MIILEIIKKSSHPAKFYFVLKLYVKLFNKNEVYHIIVWNTLFTTISYCTVQCTIKCKKSECHETIQKYFITVINEGIYILKLLSVQVK